eukprot:TRINITY_DN10213_c0_g1_i1.p1 TRINITY_DN10213_c0_g1~~TRINITY_DN10213_c0_g1_i1.p1  ORF type:complete len:185 (-),score=12.52 TRINITY_DN10213_c0_g1_i1:312-803(-)
MALMVTKAASSEKTSEGCASSSSSQGRLLLEAMSNALQERQKLEKSASSDLRDLPDPAQGGKPPEGGGGPCLDPDTTNHRRPSNKSRARYRRIVDQAEERNDFTYLCHMLIGDQTPGRLYLTRLPKARLGDRVREAFEQAGLTFNGSDSAEEASSPLSTRLSL